MLALIKNRKIATIILVILALVGSQYLIVPIPYEPESAQSAFISLEQAHQLQLSDVQLSGHGLVLKILQDDNTGSRHQRFILQTNTGQTILIAHNIDLAPRIRPLKPGDQVEFYGVYEWNSKGGVIHWTHHDPDGRHENGWLKHNGIVYK